MNWQAPTLCGKIHPSNDSTRGAGKRPRVESSKCRSHTGHLGSYLPFAPVCNSMPTHFVQIAQSQPRCDPDIELLRDQRDPQRFHCVYPSNRGNWRSRVLKTYNLGTFTSQVEAAQSVINFYRTTYGKDWKIAFLNRKANNWRIKRTRAGYYADLYVQGQLQRVTLADTKRKPHAKDHDQMTWATRQEALLAIRVYCYYHFGMFTKYYLWRTHGKGVRREAERLQEAY